eukprot:Skav203345  [mRNA]  locus=scaffold464:150026:150217:- [translate_table: standard]
MGTQYRSGARMGPRGIREASTLYQFGHKDGEDFAACGEVKHVDRYPEFVSGLWDFRMIFSMKP